MYTSDRRSESGIIPEEQVKAVEVSAKLDITWESGYLRIVKALPFFFREKLTEFGVSNSNGLKKAKVSHRHRRLTGVTVPHRHKAVAL